MAVSTHTRTDEPVSSPKVSGHSLTLKFTATSKARFYVFNNDDITPSKRIRLSFRNEANRISNRAASKPSTSISPPPTKIISQLIPDDKVYGSHPVLSHTPVSNHGIVSYLNENPTKKSLHSIQKKKVPHQIIGDMEGAMLLANLSATAHNEVESKKNKSDTPEKIKRGASPRSERRQSPRPVYVSNQAIHSNIGDMSNYTNAPRQQPNMDSSASMCTGKTSGSQHIKTNDFERMDKFPPVECNPSECHRDKAHSLNTQLINSAAPQQDFFFHPHVYENLQGNRQPHMCPVPHHLVREQSYRHDVHPSHHPNNNGSIPPFKYDMACYRCRGRYNESADARVDTPSRHFNTRYHVRPSVPRFTDHERGRDDHSHSTYSGRCYCCYPHKMSYPCLEVKSHHHHLPASRPKHCEPLAHSHDEYHCHSHQLADKDQTFRYSKQDLCQPPPTIRRKYFCHNGNAPQNMSPQPPPTQGSKSVSPVYVTPSRSPQSSPNVIKFHLPGPQLPRLPTPEFLSETSLETTQKTQLRRVLLTNKPHDSINMETQSSVCDQEQYDTNNNEVRTSAKEGFFPSSFQQYKDNSDTKTEQLLQKKILIRKKFAWKNYPELESFLIANRDEYLRHSAMNYTVRQKEYNNRLTERMMDVSKRYGYVFHKDDFDFATIRNRIRCYYKSFVQANKKKGICVSYAAQKEHHRLQNSPKWLTLMYQYPPLG